MENNQKLPNSSKKSNSKNSQSKNTNNYKGNTKTNSKKKNTKTNNNTNSQKNNSKSNLKTNNNVKKEISSNNKVNNNTKKKSTNNNAKNNTKSNIKTNDIVKEDLTNSLEKENIEEEKETQTVNIQEQVEPIKKEKKKKKLLKIISIILFVIGISIIIFFTQFGLKKEVIVEAGSIESISLKDFYKKGIIVYKSQIVSEIEEIDFHKVKDYNIKIKIFNKTKTIKLKIVDTTKPKVVFKDLTSNIDYEINPDDFIESKEDVSNMTVEVIDPPEITDYKDYKVTILVKDDYGNETSETRNLRISLFKEIVNLELGNKLTKADILFNLEKGKDYIKQEEIDEINKAGVGDFEIKVTINDIDFSSKIIVRDTLPPKLELQNVTIYTDQTSLSQDKFIKSISDASKYTLTMKSKITYQKVGKQEIKFEAIDAYNNKVEKTATLSIIEDKEGPVFSGLWNMNVNKYSKPNYYSGVSVYDAHDGKVNFTVDSSKVNTSKYGTYYITYTAVDKAGNKTTKSRKIVVNHDSSDTNAKVTQALAKSGTNFESIRQWIMNNVRYSSGNSSDPVWYGLTNYSGNCVVHAYLYQAMLNKAGYQTKIIYTTDKTHYWVMIYLNGKWRHSDATPTSRHRMISQATDQERYENLQGRNWDRNKWPKAD